MKYKFKGPAQSSEFAFYDVKFYPYASLPTEEAVFALVAQSKVYIGRLSTQSVAIVTMLHELVDTQETKDHRSLGLNSCAWCHIDQETPLLAVAGGSGQLKIIDALKGKSLCSLNGHGYGTINDVATHPLYPWIVATASMDKSLRIWDLRRHANRHQSSTIIICGEGTGHCEGVLTVSWHQSGRYLVTGGHDQRICVWTIPDLDDDSTFWRELSAEHQERSSQDVMTIYHPHFTSSAVHSNFVDCARFLGDLVMSKAAKEDKIVLWKVTGFDSHRPPPGSITAPKLDDYLDTRNGFMREVISDANGVTTVDIAKEYHDLPPYQRLLELDTARLEAFYLRFGLLLPSPAYPDLHPVLAFANASSELRFWDLQRLILGYDGNLDEPRPQQNRKRKSRGGARTKQQNRTMRPNGTSQGLEDQNSPVSLISDQDLSAGPGYPSTEATGETWDLVAPPLPTRDRQRYPLHIPHGPLAPHVKSSLAELQYRNSAFFNGRATDWSPCGRWCIVVGESSQTDADATKGFGAYAVFYR